MIEPLKSLEGCLQGKLKYHNSVSEHSEKEIGILDTYFRRFETRSRIFYRVESVEKVLLSDDNYTNQKQRDRSKHFLSPNW